MLFFPPSLGVEQSGESCKDGEHPVTYGFWMEDQSERGQVIADG